MLGADIGASATTIRSTLGIGGATRTIHTTHLIRHTARHMALIRRTSLMAV